MPTSRRTRRTSKQHMCAALGTPEAHFCDDDEKEWVALRAPFFNKNQEGAWSVLAEPTGRNFGATEAECTVITAPAESSAAVAVPSSALGSASASEAGDSSRGSDSCGSNGSGSSSSSSDEDDDESEAEVESE